MQTTHHAATRMQQRSVPQLVLDLLLEFGAREPAGNGTAKLYFDKSARRKVKAYAGTLAQAVEEHLDIYAVIAEDTRLITVGHRLERIRRH